MKNFIYLISLFYLILCFPSICKGQDKVSQNIGLTFGKPIFSESSEDSNNFSIGINYQNRFSNSFAFDLFYTYAQVSNLPNFIDNPQRLDQEIFDLNANDAFFKTDWHRIKNHSLGSKIHFLFINNNIWSFSIFGGLGYNFSNSKQHTLLSVAFIQETLEITSFENEIENESFDSFFGIYGLQTHYTFLKNYFIGLEVSFLSAFVDDNTFSTINKLPDYFNFNLILGFKF